jgi:RNA polymerase sporulation-specific sigma factor
VAGQSSDTTVSQVLIRPRRLAPRPDESADRCRARSAAQPPVAEQEGACQEARIAALVARARAGDDVATAALVAQYEPLIAGRARWCARRLRRHAVVIPFLEECDLQQEAYLLFLELLREYEPARGVPFTAYVMSKLGHRLGNYLRMQREASRRQVSLDREGDPGAPPGAAALPWQASHAEDVALVAAEARACVEPALEALPAQKRALLTEWYLHGLDANDLAESWGTSAQAVRVLHRRAIAELRWRLSAGLASTSRRRRRPRE